LPEGDVGITATADGLVQSDTIDVGGRSDGDGAPPLEFRLQRALTVAGTVLLPDGSPASGAEVEVRGVGDPPEWAGYEHAWSDAKGRFRVEGVPAGRLRVSASYEAEFEAEVEVVAATDDVVVRLGADEPPPPPGALHVRVVDADGRPVARADLRLKGAWGSVFESLRRGEAHLGAVNEARTSASTLDVTDARDERWRSLALGHARIEGIPAGEREITVRLSPGRPAAGRVVDSQGVGVTGVQIEALLLPDGRRLGASATSGEDGSFSIPQLGEYEYALQVLPPDEFVAPLRGRIRGGETGRTIRLQRGARAEIRVVDPAGEAVAGAGVAGFRPGELDEDHWADTARRKVSEGAAYDVRITDHEGVARAPALNPLLPIDVAVVPPADRPDLRAARILRWRPADTTVALLAGRRVAGDVRDGDGHPVPNTTVRLVDAEGREESESAYDGSFEFLDLPVGDVQLSVESPGTGEVVTLRVAAGTRDAVLTVEPGLDLAVVVPEAADGSGFGLSVAVRDGPDHHFESLDRSGRAVVGGLRRKGPRAVFVGPTADGRYGYVEGVPASEARIVVSLVQGRPVRVRVRAPDAARIARVRIEVLGFTLWASPDEEGVFSLPGVPSGRWPVAIRAHLGDTGIGGTGEVEAGGEVEITLR
jgi:hypothetical protein